MTLREYAACDAVGLATLIRSGQLSAREVQATAVEAAGIVNGRLNALVDGPWPEPLAYNEEGFFAGVPFVLKDLTHAAGVPMRCGSWLTGSGLVRAYDTHLVSLFRDAGLAIMALATTDEFGFGANTTTPRFGITHNPWDLSVSIGGSSGGSAALVAAGVVPAAHGSDGGGSIRIPASVAGIVGLKPSRGRVPCGPDRQEDWFGLATDFVLTRSVRDSAAMLDAVAKPMPGDKFQIRTPARPWIEEMDTPPFPLRVAYALEGWGQTPVHPDVAESVGGVVRQLNRLGHHVDETCPQLDWSGCVDALATLACVSAAAKLADVAGETGLPISSKNVQSFLLSYERYGRAVTGVQLAQAIAGVNRVARVIGEFFQHWDLFVTPTVTVPPWQPEKLNPSLVGEDAKAWMHLMFDIFRFNPVFNMSGTPAISLPLGATREGLPIGVQLAAPMCEEATLFRVAKQLETELPWAHRHPSVHVESPRVE